MEETQHFAAKAATFAKAPVRRALDRMRFQNAGLKTQLEQNRMAAAIHEVCTLHTRRTLSATVYHQVCTPSTAFLQPLPLLPPLRRSAPSTPTAPTAPTTPSAPAAPAALSVPSAEAEPDAARRSEATVRRCGHQV